ncbi:MAG: TonB-dependent receptor, partial [Deltaproteobacteria bacterium]|nr:TonB-dependent receptor [Deltaproteobacteria bacterium]
DPTDINAALYASDTVAYRHNFNHTLNYDGSYDKWDWNLSFTYGENLNEVYQSNEHMPGVYPMASSFDRTLGQASVTYSGDIFTITGGVDYLNYITGEGASTSVSNGQIANPGKPLITTVEFENLAGYLVGNVRLLEEKLIFSGGLRYDYYKVSDRRFGAEDYGFTQPSSRLKSDPTKYGYDRFATSQTYSRLSPSLGVSYLPLEFLKLRANWTHSFRPPSPRELFSSWYESYGFSGYPWNKAENTDSYEFGFDLNDKYFSFSATYFFSHTKDYVYQHEDPIQDIRRVRNTDKQRRSGIEVSFNGNVAGALGYTNIEVRPYFYLSYLFKTEELYREGRQDILGRWVNTYSSWIPKSTANYGLLVRVPSIKLTTNLNFSYWGNVYPSTVTLFTQGAYNPDLSYPSFTIVNFSLRKGLIDFGDKGNLELKLDATNIFDKLYNYGDPNPATNPIYMPGRSFYAGLVYNF